MMRYIEARELGSWMERGKDFLLVNVLPREDYEHQHIPHSVNAPVEDEDFVRQVTRHAGGNKHRDVVLYCDNPSSNAAARAARKLEHAGFVHTFEYHEGLQDWASSGRPVD